MYGIVKDIFIYFIFVIALCTVSYTHLDPKSYQFKKGLEDTFISASYGGDVVFTDVSFDLQFNLAPNNCFYKILPRKKCEFCCIYTIKVVLASKGTI